MGYTPESHGAGGSLYALQSDDRLIFYFVALIVWIIGILIWRAVDQSMSYYALEAISEDEDASAAVGVQVTKEKLKVVIITTQPHWNCIVKWNQKLMNVEFTKTD